MKYENNDFVQFLNDKNRKVYGFISKLDANKATIIEINKNEEHEVLLPSIICNYGSEPDFNLLKINVKQKQTIVPSIGSMDIYTKLEPEQEKTVIDALSSCAKHIEDFQQIKPVELNLMVNTSSRLSKSKYNEKTKTTEISLMPNVIDKTKLQEIFLHEYAFTLYNKIFSNRLKSSWIRFYVKCQQLSDYTADDYINLREDMIKKVNSGMTIKEYMKSLDERDSEAFRSAVKMIKIQNNLGINELEILIKNGDDLDGYFPKTSSKVNTGESIFITKTSKKSPAEMFAECFVFKKLGYDMPEPLQDAIDMTLDSTIKALNKQ